MPTNKVSIEKVGKSRYYVSTASSSAPIKSSNTNVPVG